MIVSGMATRPILTGVSAEKSSPADEAGTMLRDLSVKGKLVRGTTKVLPLAGD